MLIRQNQGGQILQGHPGESEVGERPVEVMVLEDMSGKTGEGRQGSEGPNQDDNRGTRSGDWGGGQGDGLVGSPCSPRDSQESSPASQFESINST